MLCTIGKVPKLFSLALFSALKQLLYSGLEKSTDYVLADFSCIQQDVAVEQS
jgi:hypothetical protein